MFRHRIPTLLVATGAVIGCLLVPSASIAGARPGGIGVLHAAVGAPSGSPGALIWYRPATLSLGSGAPSVTAWDILYHTSDALGPRMSPRAP